MIKKCLLKDGREADVYEWIRADDGNWVVGPTRREDESTVRKNTGKTPDDMREFMAQEALDYRNGGVVALDQFRYYE